MKLFARFGVVLYSLKPGLKQGKEIPTKNPATVAPMTMSARFGDNFLSSGIAAHGFNVLDAVRTSGTNCVAQRYVVFEDMLRLRERRRRSRDVDDFGTRQLTKRLSSRRPTVWSGIPCSWRVK
jgi:hypothetical protein